MKHLFIFLINLLICVQVNAIDSISTWFCHNTKNELVKFNNGCIEVEFMKRRPSKFKTADSSVIHTFKDNIFYIKSPIGGFVKLINLQNNVLIAEYKDEIMNLEEQIKSKVDTSIIPKDNELIKQNTEIVIGGLHLLFEYLIFKKSSNYISVRIKSIRFVSREGKLLNIEYLPSYSFSKIYLIYNIQYVCNDSFDTYIHYKKGVPYSIHVNKKFSVISDRHFNYLSGLSIYLSFKSNGKLRDAKINYYKPIILPEEIRYGGKYYECNVPILNFDYNILGRIKNNRFRIGKINYCH
jgi:hypothetical protein